VGRTAPIPPGGREAGRLTQVAVYARVSTDDQAEKGYGLDAQLRALRERAAARGWEIVGEYIDDGYSGATLDRPKLSALREAARTGKHDVVLTYSPDRLARDLMYSLLLERELKQHGRAVEYISVASDDTPSGNLHRQMLGAIAEFERHQIRERTMRGRLEKARRGRVPSGSRAFGYRSAPESTCGLEVIDEEAAVIRDVYRWMIEGTSVRQIVDRLNLRGVRPRRGTRWGKPSVHRLLTNPTYAGVAHFNQRGTAPGRKGRIVRPEAEWIPIPVPAIIARPTFQRVQDQLARNKATLSGRPGGRLWLLKGLLVCGACGNRLVGTSRGPRRPCYRCRGKDRLVAGDGPRCRARSWSAEKLERMVWEPVAGVLRDPEVMLAKAREHRAALDSHRVELQTEVAAIRPQLAKVQKARERLLALYLDGDIGKDEYSAKAGPLQRQEDKLARRLTEAEAIVASEDAQAKRHEAVLRYCKLIGRGIDRLDDAGRQHVLRLSLDRVVVHARRLDVHGILHAHPPGPLPPSPGSGSNRSDSTRCRPAPLSGHTPRRQPPWPFATGSTVI